MANTKKPAIAKSLYTAEGLTRALACARPFHGAYGGSKYSKYFVEQARTNHLHIWRIQKNPQ